MATTDEATSAITPSTKMINRNSIVIAQYFLYSNFYAHRGGSARSRLGFELQRLVLQKLLEAILAQFAAVARLLEAAERREHVERATVDVDLTGPQAPRDADGTRLVLRPHTAGEAVGRVVGDADRVILIAVGDDG